MTEDKNSKPYKTPSYVRKATKTYYEKNREYYKEYYRQRYQMRKASAELEKVAQQLMNIDIS